jgi:hypothetical protein
MNRVLTVILIILVSASAYLFWWQQSRIPPDDGQLASDLASIRDRRKDTAKAPMIDAIDAQTEAMLMQKQAALLRFVDLRYVVTGQAVAPASPSEVEAIDTDIASTTQNLTEAREEAAKYAGGAILAFVGMRIAVEETTLAALHQKKLMMKYGLALPVRAVQQAQPPDPDRLAALDREIAERQKAITAAEAEAARYSGGLLQLTALVKTATERATLAMLDQQRVAVKYGIAYPQIQQPSKPAGPGRVVTDKEALQ